MNNAPTTNKTSIGLEANLAALLSYLIGIIGIIILVTEKENKFVKFHAAQALLFHVLLAVIFISLIILFMVGGFVGMMLTAALGDAGAIVGIIFSIIMMILWFVLCVAAPIAALVGNIYSAIQAYNGKWFKLPIVGNITAKILGISV